MTEERIIRETIDKITMPEEVKAVDFSFSEDSTGMPAVWINLHVSDDLHPSEAKGAMFTALKREISKRIFEANADAWPYVRLIAD